MIIRKSIDKTIKILQRHGPKQTRKIHANTHHHQQQQQQRQPTAHIVEVGPRDGLQNIMETDRLLSVSQKVEFIKKLLHANCSYIEVGSFVSPKWVPSMANSQQVFQELSKQQLVKSSHVGMGHHDVTFAALVPNVKGIQQAMSTPLVNEIAIFTAASVEFCQANLNCSTIEESLQKFQQVMQHNNNNNKDNDNKFNVRGYVSCVIACPITKQFVPPVQVAKVVQDLLDMGCYQVSLGDTVGVGTPKQFQDLFQELKSVVNSNDFNTKLAMHCHDTYGQALANITAGLDHDIVTIDSSVGGLGGCPYAPGASGNVATEDVVYLLHGMGLDTGIDMNKLLDAGDYIFNVLGFTQCQQSKVARAMSSQRQ